MDALKRCTECGEEKPVTAFYRNKRTKSGLCPACKACMKDRVRRWRAANPEKARAQAARAAARLRERRGPTAVRDYGREVRRRLRAEALAAYATGGVPMCTCCGETHIEFLHIDHIAGDGGAHRRSLTTSIYGWLKK